MPTEASNLSEEASAEVTIEAHDDLADILYDALLPEAEKPSSTRSKVSLRVERGRLIIAIEASDIAALRAALNSYLRWAGGVIDAIERVQGVPGNKYKHG